MKRNSYRKIKVLAAAVAGAFTSIGVITGQVAMVLIGVLGAIVVLLVVRRRTDDILQDEMTADMARRSSHLTFISLIPVFGLAGAVLISLTEAGDDWNIVGMTLSWITLAMLGMYIVLFYSMNRRALADEE
jgi:uncharacterized membrane protein